MREAIGTPRSCAWRPSSPHARRYFEGMGRQAEVIELPAQELAPLVGLSECIVDSTPTGPRCARTPSWSWTTSPLHRAPHRNRGAYAFATPRSPPSRTHTQGGLPVANFLDARDATRRNRRPAPGRGFLRRGPRRPRRIVADVRERKTGSWSTPSASTESGQIPSGATHEMPRARRSVAGDRKASVSRLRTCASYNRDGPPLRVEPQRGDVGQHVRRSGARRLRPAATPPTRARS